MRPQPRPGVTAAARAHYKRAGPSAASQGVGPSHITAGRMRGCSRDGRVRAGVHRQFMASEAREAGRGAATPIACFFDDTENQSNSVIVCCLWRACSVSSSAE